MARQEIILGMPPQGLGGDPPRTASMKINAMTTEIYDGLGKSVKKGDFGVGGDTSPDYPDGNFGNASTGGLYRWNNATAGAPIPNSYGTTLRGAYHISTGSWTELVQSMVEPRAWLRGSINASATSFAEVHTTYNSQKDPALSTGGLMFTTTVSGWVVEKYASGAIMLTGNSATAQLAANAISAHSFAVPSVLISGETTNISCNLIPRSSIDCGTAFEYISGTTLGVIQIRNGATPQILDLRIKIVGRWK
ncbi:hypothetical protein ACI77I_29725 [Pseudomonas sp. D47]|uniref:hypothetical protein n=1 Tax=Pseudomonas sp. D47 TaxID=3159447 RepID=UPI00387AD70D